MQKDKTPSVPRREHHAVSVRAQFPDFAVEMFDDFRPRSGSVFSQIPDVFDELSQRYPAGLIRSGSQLPQKSLTGSFPSRVR